MDCDKIGELLAEHERATFKKLLENVDNGLSLLQSVVKRDDCVRLYIIYQESREWLKDSHHEVWKFVRDFEMRPLPTELLNKVVLIRLYEHSEEHTRSIPEDAKGPLLTVNVHKEQWRNEPSKCCRVITSKLWIVAETTGTSTEATHSSTAVLHEGNEIDYTHSLSATPPSQPDIQLNPVTPSQYHPIPPTQPPAPTNFETDPEVKACLMDLKKSMQQIAGDTSKTVEKLEGMGNTTDEILAVVNNTNEGVYRQNVDEEATVNA